MINHHNIESFFQSDISPEEAWRWIAELAGDSQREYLMRLWQTKGLQGWQEAKDYLVATFDPVKTFVVYSSDSSKESRKGKCKAT